MALNITVHQETYLPFKTANKAIPAVSNSPADHPNIINLVTNTIYVIKRSIHSILNITKNISRTKIKNIRRLRKKNLFTTIDLGFKAKGHRVYIFWIILIQIN